MTNRGELDKVARLSQDPMTILYCKKCDVCGYLNSVEYFTFWNFGTLARDPNLGSDSEYSILTPAEI